ncbi:MAG: hypothetical protein LUE92_00745 [Clostridiales bacterium]|nr:hypothetical protein [Clostridiales bacterium]
MAKKKKAGEESYDINGDFIFGIYEAGVNKEKCLTFYYVPFIISLFLRKKAMTKTVRWQRTFQVIVHWFLVICVQPFQRAGLV